MALLWAAMGNWSSLPAQRWEPPPGKQAMVVVTALRLAEDDPAGERTDYTVADGATVSVVARRGESREKATAPFAARGGERRTSRFLTADFSVELDGVYEITMTLKDGTKLCIPDYRLPSEWKTHFFFHSTNGTKSPASVMRFVEDPRTRIQCRIYALFPYSAYLEAGGVAQP